MSECYKTIFNIFFVVVALHTDANVTIIITIIIKLGYDKN